MAVLELLSGAQVSHREDFIAAFKQCIDDKVHPGPAEINDRLGKGRRNKLNGEDSALRIRLMVEHEIPYIRNGGYGKKGEVPHLEPLLPDWGENFNG